MASTFGTEDFIIDIGKKTTVEKHVKKIERIFQVTVSFDAISKEGENKKQWVVVSGSEAKRRHARSYILSMCYPEQTMQVTCKGCVALDDIILEEVEQKTSAFLQRTGSLSLEIKGTDLACTLAVSQLEQTYSVIVGNVIVNTDDEPSINSRKIAATRSTLNASPTGGMSNRVQTLSVDSIVDCDSDQKSVSGSATVFNMKAPHHQFRNHLPPQTNINSVGYHPSSSDHNSDQLMTSGSAAAVITTAPHQQFRTEVPPQTNVNKTFPSHSSISWNQAGAASGTATSLQPMGKVSARTESSESKSDSSSSALSGQTKGKLSQAISSKDSTPHAAKQRISYFFEFCQGLGYLESDIKETLQFFDFTQQYVENHEFLCALDQVRANNQIQKTGSDTNSSSNMTMHEGTKTVKKTNKKGEKLQGNVQQPSSNQQKTNLRKSLAECHGAANNQRDKKKGKSSSRDSGVYEEENFNKTGQASFGTPDDGVICLGEELLDDSVCIVDANPFAGGATGQSDRDLVLPSHRSGCKRKDFSDDEEQTFVMKPYSIAQQVRQPKYQEADSTQIVKAADTVTEPLPAWNAEMGGDKDNGLRFIVIDGSNVAMSHGNGRVYSCRGIKLCVDYFVKRGHRVKAFVPLPKTYKNQPAHLPPVQNQEVLDELKDEGYLEFTPARTLNHKHIVSHDDYFILDLAQLEDAVIVTKDNFREFVEEYRHIIENRLLSYVFSDDHFMLPRDPLGRFGPTLEEFLRKPLSQNPPHTGTKQGNPAKAKSTTGPAHLSIHQPFPNSQPRMPSGASAGPQRGHHPKPASHTSRSSQPPSATVRPSVRKRASSAPRHPNVTLRLLKELKAVFPEKEQEVKIQQVLDNHRGETDLNKLMNYCIAALSL